MERNVTYAEKDRRRAENHTPMYGVHRRHQMGALKVAASNVMDIKDMKGDVWGAISIAVPRSVYYVLAARYGIFKYITYCEAGAVKFFPGSRKQEQDY
jgi:hypothetical protein